MQLNFKLLGEGKPPLIILHGLFGSSDNWLTIGRKLSEDYTVYIIDQRNHGDSPHDPEHTYHAMANDLKSFIEEHKIDNPHIIGHSMGGKTAMVFAVKFPALYNKLIVVDIAPKAYPVHHDKILDGLKSIDLESVKTRSDADKQLAKYVPEIGVRQFLLKNLNRNSSKSYSWKINLDVIDRSILKISEGLVGRSDKEKPVLFIGGKNSNYIVEEDAELINNHFPNAKIEMVEGAGHWIHAEKPDKFLSIVEEFLAE